MSQGEFAVDLSPEVCKSVSFQDYSPQASIDGVVIAPLKKHRQLEGSFMELARIQNGEFGEGFEVRQVSLAIASPDRINAFHIHPKRPQDEKWTVVSGCLLVWLIDCRNGSATEGRRFSVVLSGENPAMLTIPAGVAHGYKAGHEGASLIYFMNDQFDLADPNEGRLPWDLFGSELWAADIT